VQRLIIVRNVGGSLLVKFAALHDYVHTGQPAAHRLSKMWGVHRLVDTLRFCHGATYHGQTGECDI
jgi:hypothetical protein